ncbi:MAG: hypothetical protein J5748_00590 [Bacteroidales bacterium]|nr:hypothetical protein [Bacteroidales bacterium]
MKKFLKITGAALALALAFSSCNVEPAYTLENLKNIDKDITLFQNGFQLRLADSSMFRVDSLMKSVGLDSSEFIKQAADGSYYISYSQEIDLADQISGIGLADAVKITAVNFSENINYGVTLPIFDDMTPEQKALLPAGDYTLPGGAAYDIDEQIDFDLMSADALPEMLVGVGEVTLKDVYATVELLFTDLPGKAGTTYTLNATATLPDFFSPKVIELNGEIQKNVPFSRSVKIDKFDLSAYDFAQMRQNGTNLSATATVQGSASSDNVVIELPTVPTGVSGTVSVSIKDAQDKVGIQSIQAKIDYALNETFTSPFFALPDAFADATIVLPDASVDVTVRTNMNLNLSGSADLKAHDATESVATINFTVPNSLDPAVYEESVSHNDVPLNALFAAESDSIDVVTGITTDPTKYCLITPDAQYGMDMELELNVPFAFGSGTLINFADTLEVGADAGKKVGHILRTSSIGLRANVENTIPISANLTIGFLSFNEETGSYTAIPLEHPVSVALSDGGVLDIPIGAEKDNEAIETMTHMVLGIEVSANGQVLKGDNHLLFTDIYLLLPQGIHIDGDMLFPAEEDNDNE